MLFRLTIFLSAFLLFQVQLISAKQLLPWFGGVPAVWTTCQVFFQLLLLAGYSYAHFLTEKCQPRTQGRVHLALLCVAVASLAALAWASGVPLLAPANMKPVGVEHPSLRLLLILLFTVSLPFFLLSTTGPLLQHWHSRTTDSLRETYRLYALSNVGSLLGLLSYPLGVERLLDLPHQGWGWALLFLIFVACCAVAASRARHQTAAAEKSPALFVGDQTRAGWTAAKSRPWLWLLLAFTSSAMFLATTNQLCQEVAVVPFLWALPLAIYLVTFIVCFDRPHWYSRRWLITSAALTSMAILLLSKVVAVQVVKLVLVYCVFLACFCMICHGELMRLRPGPSKLTFYYLMIAAGGAIGGAFVSIVAPLVFTGVWEFHLTIIFGWILFAVVWFLDDTSPFQVGDPAFFVLASGLVSLFVVPLLLARAHLGSIAWIAHNPYVAVLSCTVLITILIGVAFWRSALARTQIWAQLLVLAVILVAITILTGRVHDSLNDADFAARNFYGVVRVITLKNALAEPQAYRLMHGPIEHGLQFTDPQLSGVPTTYYSRSSGLGVAAQFLTGALHPPGGAPAVPVNIGVVGLGAGTIAAYARSGDRIRFYEIDPMVIEVAGKSSPYFSYLRDCAGAVEIVPGDARLSLERELAEGTPQQFDLLAEDAFSGDSIPIHLLTQEAFRLYASHLRNADSILAVHVSNSFLDLEPVIAANAAQLGFRGIVVDVPGDAPLPEASTWILLSRNPQLFDLPAFTNVNPRPIGARQIMFTDQYSNLFRVLR